MIKKSAVNKLDGEGNNEEGKPGGKLRSKSTVGTGSMMPPSAIIRVLLLMY
ncbi:hypothetical protein FHW88_005279 [Mucilaginibacter sp. SG538B]|uniref:hypothetical protein n=1 Tax=Mucilaginibacter sp. SG538B TaxID=2587021 RepID=UPI00159DEAEE|nr:hypothetical protein [Mucilaginibacter sp. SG538B]NVM66961.1 hypothetical protein [Mucilaginibacter sp. SG538B]